MPTPLTAREVRALEVLSRAMDCAHVQPSVAELDAMRGRFRRWLLRVIRWHGRKPPHRGVTIAQDRAHRDASRRGGLSRGSRCL